MAIVWFTNIFFKANQDYEAIFFSSFVLIIAAALGAIFSLYIGYLYTPSTATGKIWLLIGLGSLGDCLGEIFYTYYDLFTEEAPFPSIADVFYYLAYIPFILGLILEMRLLKINLPTIDKIVITILYIAVCVFVLVTVVIMPIADIDLNNTQSRYEYFLTALYPIFDLVVILCVLIVFMKLRHGKINTAWILLLLGYLLFTFGDIAFNWKELYGETPSLFEFYDYMFLLGYFLVFVSAITIISLMSKVFEEPKPNS